MKEEYYNKPINHNLYGKFEVMGNPGKRTERYLTRQEYLNGENDNTGTVLNLDDVINTNLPNLLYISLPCDIFRNIDFSTSRYKKKIQKASSSLFNNFMELIEDRYNLDYFLVHG